MSNAQLETAIEAAWEDRDTITPATTGETREAIEDTLNALDGGTLRVALEVGDDVVCILVADDGLGMTEEVRARAFEPFFTTKREAGGTGLGLASVYGTVRQLGGDVLLESAPGEGTRVTLRLPRSATAPAAKTGVTSLAPRGAASLDHHRGESTSGESDKALSCSSFRSADVVQLVGYSKEEALSAEEMRRRRDERGRSTRHTTNHRASSFICSSYPRLLHREPPRAIARPRCVGGRRSVDGTPRGLEPPFFLSRSLHTTEVPRKCLGVLARPSGAGSADCDDGWLAIWRARSPKQDNVWQTRAAMESRLVGAVCLPRKDIRGFMRIAPPNAIGRSWTSLRTAAEDLLQHDARRVLQRRVRTVAVNQAPGGKLAAVRQERRCKTNVPNCRWFGQLTNVPSCRMRGQLTDVPSATR